LSGWRVVGQRPEYPAAFVSDGQQIATLWQVEAPDQAVAFDRRTNVGLHHLALAVADRAGLDAELLEQRAMQPRAASPAVRSIPARNRAWIPEYQNYVTSVTKFKENAARPP
jgi:hypothetical protein